MKKIGFKLLLSGVALAACAATLSTTTYAWYVTNSEATATGVTGTTASAASDGNILVAKNDTTDPSKAGAFSQTINFAGDTTNLKTPALNPVSKDTESIKPATGATGWHKVDNSPAVAADSYIAFDIWVLSTKETTVTVEITTANTTKNADLEGLKQTCYNATGAPVDQGDTFVIDAVEALRMEVTQDTTSKVYSVKDSSKSYASPAGFTAADTDTDAQAYYAALLGKAPDGGATVDDPTEKFTQITVTANVATKLSFKIWLEGTDSMCFDSCSGQSFSFNFKFTTNNTPATPSA